MLVMAVTDAFLSLAGLRHGIKKTMPPGAMVKGFRHCANALQYAAEHAVDVAFLDMDMPRMHGLILAKKLQQLNPKINLIFIAATNHHAYDAMKMHASGYLTKPLRQERLEQEFANLRHAVAGQPYTGMAVAAPAGAGMVPAHTQAQA